LGLTKGLADPGLPLVPKMRGAVKVWAEDETWLVFSCPVTDRKFEGTIGDDADTNAILTAAVWPPVVALTATASPEYGTGGETVAVSVPEESVKPWLRLVEPAVVFRETGKLATGLP